MNSSIDRTTFRETVIREVENYLGHHHWFNGVCLDDVDDYYPDDLAGAIQHAKIETWYWGGMR